METPIILTVLLVVPSLVVPGIDVILRKGSRLAGYISLVALVASIGVVIFGIIFPDPSVSSLTPMFRNDLFGHFFALAVILVSILVNISSFIYMGRNPNSSTYYVLLLFTTLGMALLAFSVDLLMIIIAWELMTLPTFVLAGFHKNDQISNEGAVKYFVLGALSSGVLLYGASLLYGLTGTTQITEMVSVLQKLPTDQYPFATLSVAFFIAAFGLKMSLVPFHMWIPDAYEGAPATVSALLAAGTKKVGFVAAMRIFLIALPILRLDWAAALAVLAVLTMTLGNIAALTQKNIARLLAYSSIAQAGYMLIGFSVAPFAAFALIGTLFHILNHAIMKSSAFVAAASVAHQTGGRFDLNSYNGLGRRMPVTSLALSISLLALTGIPPLNGFWSKLVLFTSAIEGGASIWWAPWLAVAGILNSALSLGYYGLVIKRIYMDEPLLQFNLPPMKEHTSFAIALIIGTVLMIGIGLYPAPFYELAQKAVLSLGTAG